MKKLDHIKMLEEISDLVETDFCFDMMTQRVSGRKYTQKESKDMAEILGTIYSIAHCIHCKACQGKYLK